MTQPTAVEPTPTPASIPPVSPPVGAQPEPVQTDPPSAKTFTQDEVNRKFAEEKRRLQAKYEGFDELKAKAAKFDELQAANASELEKAVQAADAAARADVTAKTNARLVGAEIKAAAAELRFHDPIDAVLRLQSEIAGVAVDENGNVDAEAVKALVEKLATEKSHLVKTDTRPAPLPGQGLHQPSRTPGRDAGRAEAQRRFGKPPAQS